jgi:hypothetical protein
MVVEVMVGMAELLFDGECRIVFGRAGAVPTVKVRVSDVTFSRPSSMLPIRNGKDCQRRRGNAQHDWK